VKGQELAAHDPRLQASRLQLCHGQLGGCHHEGNSPEGQPYGLPEFDGNVLVRGRLFVDEAQSGIVCDMLNSARMEHYARGILDHGQAYHHGNARLQHPEGNVSRKMTSCPCGCAPRPCRGSEERRDFTDEDTKKMQDSYYAYYGGRERIPTEETLKKLKLDFAIADVVKKA